jgi:hypothetical protein
LERQVLRNLALAHQLLVSSCSRDRQGLPTEVPIAQVIVAKFGDHLSFYRQADIYAR